MIHALRPVSRARPLLSRSYPADRVGKAIFTLKVTIDPAIQIRGVTVVPALLPAGVRLSPIQ